MAFCSKCGANLPAGASSCANCGQSTGSAVSSGSTSASVAAPAAQTGGGTNMAEGMTENVAGLLCYSLGWITGLIFFLIDKRPFVRFHAAQSMIVFGGLQIILFVLGRIFIASIYTGGLAGFTMGSGLISLLDLLAFVLWIVLMIKAYQGQRFKLPVAGDLAENFAGK
jgi:uncharacterized membrane protein